MEHVGCTAVSDRILSVQSIVGYGTDSFYDRLRFFWIVASSFVCGQAICVQYEITNNGAWFDHRDISRDVHLVIEKSSRMTTASSRI